MKKIIFILVLGFILKSCKPISYTSENFSECYPKITQSNKNKLIIMGGACGWALQSLHTLKEQIPTNENLDIFYIDFSNDEAYMQKLKSFFQNVIFIAHTECISVKKPKFYPTFYLYNTENQLVWRKDSYSEKLGNKVLKKLNLSKK